MPKTLNKPESDAEEGVVEEAEAAEPAESAEAAAEAEATQEDSESPDSRVRRPVLRVVAFAAAAFVLLGSLATAGILGWQLHSQRAVDDAAQQAVAAAQQYAVILTSIDGGQLDQNFAAVLDGSTGEFKDMYSQSSDQLRQALIDNKAKANGTVIAAGVKSATDNKVEVLLFVDQSVSNALNPEPRLDRSRIIMTMEKVNGRWLASKVELP